MSKPGSCICDLVYGVEGATCEASIKYLCEHLSLSQAKPFFVSDGQPVEGASAISGAIRLMKSALYPVIVGIDLLGVRSQQQAIELCKLVSGVIDTSKEQSGRAGLMSLIRNGGVTATLGEVVDRSEAVLIINCKVSESYPRLNSLLSSKQLYWLGASTPPEGIENWIAVGEADLENALIGLEAILTGIPINEKIESIQFESSRTSLSFKELLSAWIEELVLYPHLCVVEDSANTVSEFGLHSDVLSSLVRKLNSHCRAVALDVSSRANDRGAHSVSTWSLGFPFAVDFAQGIPRNFGMEFSYANIKRRRECDLVIEFRHSLDSQDRFEKSDLDVPSITFTSDSSFDPSVHQGSITFGGLSFSSDTFLRFDDVSFEVDTEFETLSLEDQLRRICQSFSSENASAEESME